MAELSEQEIVRRNNLQQMRELGIDPYPAAEYPTNAFSTDIKENFEEGKEVCIAGRMMSRRVMGKASFIQLMDSKGRIQVYVTRDALPTRVRRTTRRRISSTTASSRSCSTWATSSA